MEGGSGPRDGARSSGEEHYLSAPAERPEARGIIPASVWLVENGAGFEQYSNGLRIDTTLRGAGDAAPLPRLRARTAAAGGGPRPSPVGILFHTSESDVWPLEAAFNENLRDSSQRLLRYVSRNRLYHYLIDRFGRVYRVVGEDSKANHAGHSRLGGRRPHLPEPEQRLPRRLLRDALGRRPRPAHHPGAARRRAQPDRLPAPAVRDRAGDVRDPRPDQREPARST